MKILGIDYGEKKIGLAISDESQTLAREWKIVSPNDFFKQIKAIISENQIVQLVIGWPLNMKGKETKKTQEVKKFREKLEKLTEISTEIIDERLSSEMTKSLPGGQKNKDSLAAQIILQNYLDKTKTDPNAANYYPNDPKGIHSDNSDAFVD